MKNVLNEVIAKLKTKKNKYCRITHRKGWSEYLKEGDMVFRPHELHQILREIVDSMRPRGKMLLYPRKRTNFTVTSQDKPYRREEALERFITLSNPDNYCNQFPLRGRKESSDIAILNDGTRHLLIELKPWRSNNSPLYALVESLKNLIEYRIIEEKSITYHRDFTQFNEADLIVLAPESYYQDYGLIDKSGSPIISKLQILKRSVDELSAEFKTNISFMMLPLEESSFYERCRTVCNKYKKTTGLESIDIQESDSIPELARDKWKPLVSSDRELSRSKDGANLNVDPHNSIK